MNKRKLVSLLDDFIRRNGIITREEIQRTSSVDTLMSYRNNVDQGTEHAIKVRLVEVFPKTLSRVTDIKKLIEYWQHSCDNDLRALIEARIAEILPDVFSDKDVYEFSEYWGFSSLGMLIVARMIKSTPDFLKNVTDVDKLIKYYFAANCHDGLRNLTKIHLAEILPATLPSINNINKLICLESIFSSDAQMELQIRKRIEEVSSRDIDKAIIYFDSATPDDEEKIAFARAVMAGALSGVMSLDELEKYWQNASHGRGTERDLLAARMNEILSSITDMVRLKDYCEADTGHLRFLAIRCVAILIESVDARSVPDWFILVLRGKLDLPSEMQKIFAKKVRELKEDIKT
ncbi:MAG: hypothetical protein ABH881_03015 [bacterium]